MDQPGKVANPARGQLNRESEYSQFPYVPENLVSRGGFSRPVPRQPAHLHTQAESGACQYYRTVTYRERTYIRRCSVIISISPVLYEVQHLEGNLGPSAALTAHPEKLTKSKERAYPAPTAL